MKKGITLIGMPGAGKSAIGRRLAPMLGWKFIDLDDMIAQTQGISHNEYMLKHGEQGLMDLEGKLTLGLTFDKVILSPPGSIIFSPKAMEKIKKETTVVYLVVSLDGVRAHLGERMHRNGIIGLEEKGIEGVFNERTPIYEKIADITIDCRGMEDKDYKTQKVYEALVREGLVNNTGFPPSRE